MRKSVNSAVVFRGSGEDCVDGGPRRLPGRVEPDYDRPGMSHEGVSIYCEIDGLYTAFVNEELALIIRLMSLGQV